MALSEWAGFFSAEVGASAALTGLVTVAISINLTRILEIAHLPGRAAESLLALTSVFAICSVALFPGMTERGLGGLALALAALLLAAGVRNQRRQAGYDLSPPRRIVGAITRLSSTLPIGAGGALLLVHDAVGLTSIAAGVVIALAVSVLNAWVLLVEIIR